MTTGPSRSVQQAALQPALLFSIFDQFQHRNELCTGRLIGAIFGERAEETQTVTISQAFPIPHSEVNDQVNINSDYYKNRAELLRTCYGKTPYILGWYSVALEDGMEWESEAFASATSFIHEVFSKEVAKSSPMNEPHGAIHLDIRIGAAIAYSVRTGTPLGDSAAGSLVRYVFSPVSATHLAFGKAEAMATSFILRALAAEDNAAMEVSMPSAASFVASVKGELGRLVSELRVRASSDPRAAELLAHLPDARAAAGQAAKFASDVSLIHDAVQGAAEQLASSQQIFLGSQ